jgi:Holliday junction resolvasome RuvABC ATP-dependent DNA helicase subunit
MTFVKAERKQHKPKLALTGPSGAGKTYSALLIASGMGNRIAVIDTENGSASLYANMDKGPLKGLAFDVL